MRALSVFVILLVSAVILIGIVLTLGRLAAKNDFTLDMTAHFSPILVPSSAIAANLTSDSGNLVYDSLDILAGRKDPIAVARATELLSSPDPYTWLNAALYLAACGHKESVPYLIKALHHPAYRSYPEEAQYLHELTGQDFGEDFQKWKTWWEATHPNAQMDWKINPPVPVDQ